MKGLIGKLDAIKEAKWYKDYPKKWRGKLGEYAIKDNNLQEKIEKSGKMEEGKKTKIITKIDSWKKEIEKLYKRYQYHHEAESSFPVYLSLIEESLRRHVSSQKSGADQLAKPEQECSDESSSAAFPQDIENMRRHAE